MKNVIRAAMFTLFAMLSTSVLPATQTVTLAVSGMT